MDAWPSLQNKCKPFVDNLPFLEDGPNKGWQLSNRCTVGQWFEPPRAARVHPYVKRPTLRRLLRLGSIATRDVVTPTPTLRPPVGDNPSQQQLPPQLRDASVGGKAVPKAGSPSTTSASFVALVVSPS